MIEDLSECYRILELAPGATQEEVKRSYRELVKVWHPDRFSGDPKLQKKAQEKLKQINLAYEWICKGEAGGPRRRSSHAGTNASQPGEQSRPSGSSSSTNNRGEPRAEAPRQPPPPSQPTPAPTTNWGRRIVQFAATVVIIAVIKAVFSTGDHSRRQTSEYAVPYDQPSGNYPAPASDHATANSDVDNKTRVEAASNNRRVPVSPTPNDPKRDFFTLGSTKEEVLAVQGTPDKFSDTMFGYGLSEVFFRDGRVESWDQSVLNPLKAKLLPATPTEGKGYFTVGSTKDEVLAVQGTPDQFSDRMFKYGLSQVFFRNGRVESWDQSVLNPLKAK